MEALALFYLVLGMTLIGAAHLSKYGSTYIERVPVAFSMSPLKRWIDRILNQVKVK